MVSPLVCRRMSPKSTPTSFLESGRRRSTTVRTFGSSAPPRPEVAPEQEQNLPEPVFTQQVEPLPPDVARQERVRLRDGGGDVERHVRGVEEVFVAFGAEGLPPEFVL